MFDEKEWIDSTKRKEVTVGFARLAIPNYDKILKLRIKLM